MEGTGILQRHELSVFTAKLSFIDKFHIFSKSRYFEGSPNMFLSLSHPLFEDKLLHSLQHNIFTVENVSHWIHYMSQSALLLVETAMLENPEDRFPKKVAS